MSIYSKRRLGNRRAGRVPTTQHQVRAMLDNPTQRAALLARTDRTVDLLRTLVGRDPREMAYVLGMQENDIDAWSGYLDLTLLVEWVAAAKGILGKHPQVQEFMSRDDRAVVKGRMLRAVPPGKGGPA